MNHWTVPLYVDINRNSKKQTEKNPPQQTIKTPQQTKTNTKQAKKHGQQIWDLN